MNEEDHFSKFFLIVAVVCLIGLLILLLGRSKAPAPSPVSSSLSTSTSQQPQLTKVQKVKSSLTKKMEGENCYQYEGDRRWFYTSSDGVELYWDESVRCFRIDGKMENGEMVADNPDGKRFQLKEGKWVYHQTLTKIDWRIDPQGRYYLKEREGKYISEHGHALVRTFQGWMIDDGPRLGSQRMQWGVDVEGYYLKSAFKKDGYHGVVMPSGVELRWREGDLKSLEFLNVAKSASDMTWVPQPLGQLPTIFKIDPADLYKQLIEEQMTPQWDQLVRSFESEAAQSQLKLEIQKTFGVSIREEPKRPYLPQFLLCVALTLDCYPRERVSLFLQLIDYKEIKDFSGLAYADERRIEMDPLKSGRAYSIHWLIKTLQHEYGHNISLGRGLGFNWNEFRSIHPTFRYTNVYDLNRPENPQGSFDIAREYGRTNEREDVATISEMLMTDPTDLSPKKSDFFKRKYAYLSRFYNNLFGFHFNSDYMNNRVFEASHYEWKGVSQLVSDLPPIRLE